MLESYYTVKPEGSEEITIQKSRFIGYVKRCETEEEAQAFIQEIKKKHNDATHNCSAYMIGEHDLIQKANDDGEPSGTAGVPMLEVLKKRGLKDTAVVVTRYFGGIKLGAGGLIRAYGSTASEAIHTTGVVKRQLMQEIKVKIDYTLLGKVENEVRNSTYTLETVNYLENVELIIYVESGLEEEFESWMVDLTSGQAAITRGGTSYVEFDVTPE
ncbi:YigZ family protein [Halobacillus litoralis]|uniref:YigZ family protein n=1 Tax=Halobacillus litoralis TaxID=45668 RepID=A0A845E5L7_9BACI|nr:MULTISPECIES: YigZ family protein [Halobacillus]MYL20934.1 YigZ family protein [Halobacillus litoralis]MYL30973.1 YigZ family protein [Halobacillus halophilus]